MIRTLLIGVARLLFNAALLAMLGGAILLYASWRLLRAAFAKDAGRPVRDAGFGVLLALAGLAVALKQRMPELFDDELATEDDDGVMTQAERDALAARLGL